MRRFNRRFNSYTDIMKILSGHYGLPAPYKTDRVFKSTRIEDMIHSDLRAGYDIGLGAVEAQGSRLLDTFPSMLRDVFQALYSINLRKNEPEALTEKANAINKPILDAVLSAPEYSALKEICTSRDIPSYEAILSFSDFLLNKLRSLTANQDTAKVIDSLSDKKAKIERQLADIMRKPETDMTDNDKRRAVSAANAMDSLDEQISHVSRYLEAQTGKEIIPGIPSAMQEAGEKASEAKAAIALWGNGDSSPTAVRANLDMLRRVRGSAQLSEAAKHLGRLKDVIDAKRKNSLIYGRGEKYDVELGNNINKAISSEFSLLALPETRILFIRKVLSKRLKQYRQREKISKGKGDFIICLDSSSSMRGERDAWAKAVALALLDIAATERRKCAVVLFASSELKEFIFQPGEYGFEDIVSLSETFLGGGTNFEKPLSKTVELITKYGFKDADIVFISDGECSLSDGFRGELKGLKEQLKFTITGVLIDDNENTLDSFSLEPFCEKMLRVREVGRAGAADMLISERAV